MRKYRFLGGDCVRLCSFSDARTAHRKLHLAPPYFSQSRVLASLSIDRKRVGALASLGINCKRIGALGVLATRLCFPELLCGNIDSLLLLSQLRRSLNAFPAS